MHPTWAFVEDKELLTVRPGGVITDSVSRRLAWTVGRRIVAVDDDYPDPTVTEIRRGVGWFPTKLRLAVRRKAQDLQSKAARHMAAHSENAVVTGGPGTGKTTMYAEFVALEIKQARDVIVCAPTATAASHLPQCKLNGRTFDAVTISRMLLPSFWKSDKAARSSRRGPPVKLTTVLIDEYSMASAGHLDGIYAALTQRGEQFRIILGGDIQQLPPPSGASPVASAFATVLMENGANVYTMKWNWRFQNCERMQAFNVALRSRDFGKAMEYLGAAAMQHPRLAGPSCRARHVAYTHRQLAIVNNAEHERLKRLGSPACTYVGGDGSRLTVCHNELMVIKANVYDSKAKQYSQRNGQTGVAIIEATQIVKVEASTRVSLRLANGDLLLVEPKALTPAGCGSAKSAAVFTFVGMLAPCTGFTAHSAQGATMDEGDTLTIDMKGIPNFELCLVVLTRHPYFKQIRVINLDVAQFQRLFTLCPCGHDQRQVTSRIKAQPCSPARVQQRLDWIKYTETHVVHVPFGHKTSAGHNK